MYFFDLLKNNSYLSSIKTNINPLISGITCNSLEVKPGNIFVALRGANPTSKDGHDFIKQAIEKKASIIIAEYQPDFLHNENIIIVKDSAKAFSYLSEAFYDWPSRKISIIGITGTNGKTSTSFMLWQILNYAHKKVKVMGTLGMGDINNLTPLTHTTMHASFISEQLNRYHEEGIEYVVMEISSHALALKRVAALNFSVVALTNITQDHLDFHKNMENYKASKKILFTDLSTQKTLQFIPNDNPLDLPINSNVYKYGLNGNNFAIKSIKYLNNSSEFIMNTPQGEMFISLPLQGSFQIYNACLAASIALKLGINKDIIINALKNMPNINGRFQNVKEALNKKDLRVVIDFAHTPDALENTLKTACELKHERIILVFGCGGNRDSSKREIMGSIATRYAHIIFVTDDNPRDENPENIRKQIINGIKPNCLTFEIADRRQAIEKSLALATKKDIVIIAGKGHENYQIYNDKKTYFSDYETVVEIINSI